MSSPHPSLAHGNELFVCPTHGNFGRERTPSEYCLFPSRLVVETLLSGHSESRHLKFSEDFEYHEGTYE